MAFVALCTALGLMCAGLAVLVTISAAKAGSASGPERKYFAWASWVALVLLGVTFVALVWVILHRIRSRFRPPSQRTRTEHISAWQIAGQRFRLEEGEDPVADDEEGEESDPEDR